MFDVITSTNPRIGSGTRKKRWLLRGLLLLVLSIMVVGLSGCQLKLPASPQSTPTVSQQQSGSAEPYPPAGQPDDPLAATSYPAPDSQPEPGSGPQTAPTAYPAPDVMLGSPTAAYPAPAQPETLPATPSPSLAATVSPATSPAPYPLSTTPAATEIPASAYPGPQAADNFTPTPLAYPDPLATPSPGQPLQAASPTSFPYPGPAQTLTPVQQVTQTPRLTQLTPGSATVTVIVDTPTPTLSPTVVRTVFKPSDPADFKLVSDKPQLLTFYAIWAPDSEVMAPVIYNLEGRYGERVGFVYLDLDAVGNSIFKEMLKSKLPPAFFLLSSQGELIRYWSGRVALEELDSAIRSISP
jgi:thiol-disulfide isomerase/thioredoxin